MASKKRKSSKRRTKKGHKKAGIRSMKELEARLKLRKHTKRGKK